MDLQKLATRLDIVKIDNLENIAQTISATNQAEYGRKFALEIVKQKLDRTKVMYSEFCSEFPYFIINNNGSSQVNNKVIDKEDTTNEQGNRVLVGVCSELLIVDIRKSFLLDYAKKIKNDFSGFSGLIQFMPFQINGSTVRTILEREINVAFVNLPYDKNSLERRFRQYSFCKK